MEQEITQSKQYLFSRGITEDTVSKLLKDQSIEFKPQGIRFAMKNIQGYEVTGRKYRPINPTDKKEINEHGSKMAFFCLLNALSYIHGTYGDMEKNLKQHDVFIVEGSIDYCTMLGYADNVIGLPTIVLLPKLVKQIKEMPVHNVIYLLTDNDVAGDNSICQLKKQISLLDYVFDCRAYFTPYKDINEFVMAGNTIDVEEVKKHAKPLV